MVVHLQLWLLVRLQHNVALYAKHMKIREVGTLDHRGFEYNGKTKYSTHTRHPLCLIEAK